ncbi:uncharacterized protein Dwil_GK11905 [Drosophila willistoni]|uniref:Pickpocket protein 19 n=1 Tax=Drosophila willistoni TaxID=7260 RepID=B4NBI7_DROWI|nr:pickpocket protein 19 [Drosophila willistoni]EDW81151.1 uncharacterized protein Dwil_GK11905 [Drosophila willistoni]
MFYPLELPRPRPRRPLFQNYGSNKTGLLLASKVKNRDNNLKHSLLLYLKEYCECSSIHGIRYLADPKLRFFERIIWLLLLVATSICAIFVYVDLTELYHAVRIQTTIKDSMQPIFFVPFPSVGICPRNRVNWIKLERDGPNHFLGANVTEAQKQLFISFFSAAGDVHLNRLNNMDSFYANATLASSVSQLDELNVSEVLEYLQLECKDIFYACNWRGMPKNCCEIFELEHTESGLCWVFNSEVSPAMRKKAREDQFYPYRTARSGEGTGLDVFLSLNKSLIRLDKRGVYVMIKQPQQWSDNSRLVPHNAHTRISMAPRFTTTDNRTRSVPPSIRRCIFPDEKEDPKYKNFPDFIYWVGNCRSRCHQEHVVDLCKCSPSLLFPVSAEDNFTDCKPSDFKCLYDHRQFLSVDRHAQEKDFVDNKFKESMICDCFTSCTQLIHEQESTISPLDYNEIGSEVGTLRLDIFFQSNWYIQYETHMRFTFVELLANFGGIIGLFLGASLLSGVELIYYFTIGLYLYLRNQRNIKPQKVAEKSPITVHFYPKITPTKITY